MQFGVLVYSLAGCAPGGHGVCLQGVGGWKDGGGGRDENACNRKSQHTAPPPPPPPQPSSRRTSTSFLPADFTRCTTTTTTRSTCTGLSRHVASAWDGRRDRGG